ncbi:hypothetical protein AGMMS50218_09970 [Actinomycetota bacterium]|nr:hypothetical protein AGMMS50218_09970 [Actinomycetota bacterium]
MLPVTPSPAADRARPARRARRSAPALTIGAAVLVAALTGLTGCTGGDGATDAATHLVGGPGTTGGDRTDPTGGTGEGAPGGGSADGGAPGQEATAADPGPGPASEILPDAPAAPPVLGAITAPQAPATDRLTGPLPATASSRGELVAGYPTSVVPVPDGATVVSSSVSAQGDRLQIGLEASTDADPTAVLDAFVASLSAKGFTEELSPALPGTTATAFTRESDGVVLTLRERLGGGTELSIAGVLVTAG